MLSDSQQRLAVVGVAIAWIIFALAVDRYILRDSVPWLSHLLYFRDAEIVVQPFSRKFAWLGLTLLLFVPSVLVAVFLSAYLRIKKRTTTSESLMVFGVTAFWFLLIPVLMWIGHNVYRFFKSFLDDWAWAKGLVSFLEGFTFKGDLYIYSFKFWTVDSGLGALAGLALGIFLLYNKGLWQTLKDAV